MTILCMPRAPLRSNHVFDFAHPFQLHLLCAPILARCACRAHLCVQTMFDFAHPFQLHLLFARILARLKSASHVESPSRGKTAELGEFASRPQAVWINDLVIGRQLAIALVTETCHVGLNTTAHSHERGFWSGAVNPLKTHKLYLGDVKQAWNRRFAKDTGTMLEVIFFYCHSMVLEVSVLVSTPQA